jgi:adenylate cyclase
MRSRFLLAAVFGLAAGLAGLVLGRVPFFEVAEAKLYDLDMRWTVDPANAHPAISVVEIDEISLRRLEPVVGRWPWPRLVHAVVIDFLARGPAKAVAYDVSLTDRDRSTGFEAGGTTWTGAQSDQALVDSTRAAGNVIHLAEGVFEGAMGADDVDRSLKSAPQGAYRLDDSVDLRPALSGPFPGLGEAARALGHNVMLVDEDGPVRQIIPFVRREGVFLPSFGIAAAQLMRDVPSGDIRLENSALVIGTTRLPAPIVEIPRFDGQQGPPQKGRRSLIRYRGPAILPDGRTPTYRTYSFYDLFYSEQQLLEGQKPLIDPAAFKGGLVFIGATAVGLKDVFAVPLGATGAMAGPHIHANVADMVLSGRVIHRLPTWLCVLLTLLVSVGARYAVMPARISLGVAAAVGVIVSAHLGGLLAFGQGLWVPLVPATLGWVLATGGGFAYQYLVEGREKRQVRGLFSRYLSKDVYEQVLANPSLAELGGKRRTMSVLFSDMRGFTTLSESGDPEALVQQLNEYFSRMVDVVFEHRGTLDKFVGDMVMALYGAPLDDEDHAEHAVATAVAMVRALEELNAGWAAQGRPTLGIGIGINSGEMIAGTIGSRQVRSYTVIGDAVNLGARLESLNKEYGTSIIISDATRRQLRSSWPLRPLGSVVVKGKSVAVDIYEVEVRSRNQDQERRTQDIGQPSN